jgi:cell pole-organizing protein PopZ
MSQTAKAQEPSMEEILASIRRIIADDDANKTTSRAPEPPKPEPPPAPPPAPPVYVEPPAAMSRPVFEETPGAAQNSFGSEGVADQAADILDLTESMAAPTPDPVAATPLPVAMPSPAPAPQFQTIDGSSDIGFADAGERPAPQPAYDDMRNRLMSGHTSAAVDSAFNALAQTVLVQNARTLEDLVREMLRPMLKTWLDDNLPGLVERLVRAEIERVSRGRTG